MASTEFEVNKVRSRGLFWLIPPAALAVFLAFTLFESEKPEPEQGGVGDPEVRLRIHGSNTLGASFIPRLSNLFLSERGANAVRIVQLDDEGQEDLTVAEFVGRERPMGIQIHAHGSSTGFNDLEQGLCDIAASSRAIKKNESRRLGERGLGDMTSPENEHVVALDGVAVIVHPDNPVTKLTVEQIAGIYSGEIDNWSEIGGAELTITRVARDEKSGTFDLFNAVVLRNERTLEDLTLRLEDSAKLSKVVSGDPAAIGFVGLPYIAQAKALAVSADGSPYYMPNEDTVKSEVYPLSRRLYFYTPTQPESEMTAAFVAFARSNEGQRLAREVNLVDLSLQPRRLSASDLDNAPQPYIALARNHLLVATIRFEAAGSNPDSRGKDDLRRVIDLLRTQAYRGKRVSLVGHASGGEGAQYFLDRSQRSAEVIAERLREGGIQVDQSTGLGFQLPVSGNRTTEGRRKNLRVEIFVED